MDLQLTKYGRREIVLCEGAASLCCDAIIALMIFVSWAFTPLLILPLAFGVWVLWFFRDPERATPQGPGLLVSPADGTVTDITAIGTDSVLGAEGVKIGIFMSVFSVHVNRSPEAAVVRKVDHRPGLFLDARDLTSSERNESTTIYLELDRGGRKIPIVIRQIAGLIARRIVTDLEAGQSLQRGQRIGMIKFGSRMEVLVPREMAGGVRVKIGDKTLAGLTVLIDNGGR